MVSSRVVTIALIFLTGAIFVAEELIDFVGGYRLFLSLLTVTVLLLIRQGLEAIFWNRMEGPARYSLRKALRIGFWIAVIFVLIRVWVDDPQTLLLSYGVLVAGVAFAVQDVLKSFASGLVILFSELYRTGDRIEIMGTYGDVLDIGLLTTSILEMKEWVAGDQATGRIVQIPNAAMWQGVKNYTKDNRFIWDEIAIPITYEADGAKARKIVLQAAKKASEHAIEDATKELKRMREKYYFSERSIQPAIYTRLTDNWLELTVRFITPVDERREVASAIHEEIGKRFKKAGIEIASATVDIVGFPGK